MVKMIDNIMTKTFSLSPLVVCANTFFRSIFGMGLQLRELERKCDVWEILIVYELLPVLSCCGDNDYNIMTMDESARAGKTSYTLHTTEVTCEGGGVSLLRIISFLCQRQHIRPLIGPNFKFYSLEIDPSCSFKQQQQERVLMTLPATATRSFLPHSYEFAYYTYDKSDTAK